MVGYSTSGGILLNYFSSSFNSNVTEYLVWVCCIFNRSMAAELLSDLALVVVRLVFSNEM